MNTMKKLICKLLILLTFATPISAWAKNVVVNIQVKGMTCPLCVSMINKALTELDGVVKAKASLREHKAVVIVPEGYNTDLLLKAIEGTGYTGTVESITEE